MILTPKPNKYFVVGIGNSAASDDYVTFGKITKVEILPDGIIQFDDEDGDRHWVGGDWNVWEETQ